jgi:uncharacterized protein (DUF1697 family)
MSKGVRALAKYVALLRGVNVGGRNKLPMKDLRALLESLGHGEVETFIQSGNVIFTATKAVTPKSLESAIAKQFALDITVVIRTPRELAAVVKANPFPRADTSTLHVGFMAKKPAAATVAKLDAERFLPDEFAIRGCELYLHVPSGMGRAKLPGYLDRQLKVPTTVRNWNTVRKLIELSG